jgi:hypothetical protein
MYMPTLTCIECGKTFQRHGKSDFCTPACKAKFHNRRSKRGARLYDAVMLRTSDPEKFPSFERAIELMIAEWIEEDRKAGRKRSTLSAHTVRYKLPNPDIERTTFKLPS